MFLKRCRKYFRFCDKKSEDVFFFVKFILILQVKIYFFLNNDVRWK